MLTCLISNEGKHDPPWHYMKVDGFGLLVDLSGVRISAVDPGSLTDPTIKRVEWGPVQLANGETVERGMIVRQDGSVQTFFEKELLNNYLHLYEVQKAKLVAAHAEAVTAEDAERQRALTEAAAVRAQQAAREVQKIEQQAQRQAEFEAESEKHAALVAGHAAAKEALEARIADIEAEHAEAAEAQRAFEAEQANLKAEEAAMREARSAGTIEGFTGYLKMFQAHAAEAKRRIAELLAGVTKQ